MTAATAVPPSGAAAVAAAGSAKFFGVTTSPEARSVIYMALAMSMHFFGYEFARNTSLAIFTSNKSGFSGPTALSLAMACVTPFSALLLMAYGRQLESYGPRLALRHSTLFCALAFSVAGGAMETLERRGSSGLIKFGGFNVPVIKVLVFVAFLVQNSYAHLLYTQHWSFIGSVLTPSQGATWFSPISGVTSITSTLAATLVSRLVASVSLPWLFGGATSLSLFASLACAEKSYSIADKFNFVPSKHKGESAKNKQSNPSPPPKSKSIVKKATDLFAKVPTLRFLFWEVVCFQSLSTVLSVSFITQLKAILPEDAPRAAWTSSFWAVTNATSGVFQFLILPVLFKMTEPRVLWKAMPFLVSAACVFQCLQSEPSLYLAAGAFFLAKVMDYSLRGVISEMVYVPLDFDSRYLGKEVVGVFGNRLGKSGMSVGLSALSGVLGSGVDVTGLIRITALASFSWLVSALSLGNAIPRTKVESEKEKHKKTN